MYGTHQSLTAVQCAHNFALKLRPVDIRTISMVCLVCRLAKSLADEKPNHLPQNIPFNCSPRKMFLFDGYLLVVVMVQ